MTDENIKAGNDYSGEITSSAGGPWSPDRPGWDPVLAMKTIRNTMNELISDIFQHGTLASYEAPFKPSIDICSDGEKVLILVSLPGVKREEIQIHATQDLVIIQGVFNSEPEDGNVQYFCRERPVGSFSRSIPLPYRVFHDKIKARLQDGLLKITIPLILQPQGEPVRVDIE